MSSAKPLIFISYAHLDEPDPPEQPAEGKICLAELCHEIFATGREGPQIRGVDGQAHAGGRGLEPGDLRAAPRMRRFHPAGLGELDGL